MDKDPNKSFDTAIVKKERFDVSLATRLVNCANTPAPQKRLLKKMLKNRQGDVVEVHYKLGRKTKIEEAGRYWASMGLQRLSKVIRGSLAIKYYWDVDMVNAQPTLLLQYAERHGWVTTALRQYCENRESLLKELNSDRQVAKEMITPLFYGQVRTDLPDFFLKQLRPEIELLANNIAGENIQLMRSYKSDKWAVLQVFLSTLERSCLLCIDRAVAKRNRSLDTFIHDGGLVTRFNNEEEFPTEDLRYYEQEVLEHAGYTVQLVVKPMVCHFESEKAQEIGIRVLPGVIIDHVYAAKAFKTLYEGRLVLDGGVMWMFDECTGLWTNKELAFLTAITACGNQLIFIQTNDEGRDVVHNYSGNVRNSRYLLDKLITIIPPNDGYFFSRIDSAVGKLLFKNGIYDFESHKFTRGFDPDIIFHHAIPRDFPEEVDDNAVAFVHKTLFRDPFSNPAVGDIYLHYIMRGIVGHYRIKKLLFCIGRTNSSKGTVCSILRDSFGEAIGSFTGDSLLVRTGDVEATRALSWIKKIHDKRISFSNEITCVKNKSLNGNLLKTLASGGDEITLRTVYNDEERVVNQSTMALFMNDLPPIAPMDDALRERMIAIWFDYSFVNEPQKDFEKKMDRDLKVKLKEVKYLDAFVHLIVNTYQDWIKMGGEEPTLPDECKNFKNEIAPLVDWKEVIEEEYEITGNSNDAVLTRDLIDLLRSHGMEGSEHAIGRILTDLGFMADKKRIDGRVCVVRSGLRLKEQVKM